jgi:acetyltransferase-like isoleucine patch superfamily enzyme
MKIRSIIRRIHEKILEQASVQRRVTYFRRKGMKIGENCNIDTMSFSTEPFLIEIGNNVSIAGGTQFITHDGSVRCFRDVLDGGIFGRIKIGNNVFIGANCIILLNTTIGDNCIIGAGSIVRGHFPGDSVIFGNPAKVVLKMSIQKMLYRHNPGLVKTDNLTIAEAQKLVKEHFGIE